METLNNKKTLKAYIIIATLFIFFIWLTAATSIYANEKVDALLFTLQKCEINSTTDIFLMFFRMLGFGFIKILASIADTCYEGLNQIYNALDFAYSSELLALNKRYSFLYKLVFVISVAMLGLYLIGRNTTNQLNTTTCIMLIAVIIIGMPIFTEKLGELTKAGASYAQEQWTSDADKLKLDSISGAIVSDYLIDLKKVDNNINEKNVKKLENAVKKNTGYNNIDEDSKEWRYIDINEAMDYKEESFKNNIWDQKIEKGENGYTLTELSTWVPFMDKYYYRYQMSSWIQPILLLLILSVILMLTIFRCGVFIVDIAAAQVYMPFVAITDLTSGQRIKEGIKHVFVLFGSIFLCIALIGIYFVGYNWINVHIQMSLVKIIFQLALAWKIIDGPDLIERILGVDVGVKDGWKTIIGLGSMSRTIESGVKAAGHVAKTPVQAVKAGINTKNKGQDAINSMKQKNATANAEASKWKPAGRNDGSDPMFAKTTNDNKNNDPKTSATASTSIGSGEDPMSAKGKASGNNVQTSEKIQTHDPMSRRGVHSNNNIGNIDTSQTIDNSNPIKHSSNKVNFNNNSDINKNGGKHV